MGSHPILASNQAIVFFDSNCLLCNKTVQFMLKADQKQQFVFAGLSSQLGAYLLSKNRIKADSVVLFYKKECFLKSEAILISCKILGFPYSLLQIFYIVPKFIRNWLYDIIASHRASWFGTTNQCLINTEKYSDRIIL